MEAQADVVEVRDLAGGVGDVVLWALVLEVEEAAGGCQLGRSPRHLVGEGK